MELISGAMQPTCYPDRTETDCGNGCSALLLPFAHGAPGLRALSRFGSINFTDRSSLPETPEIACQAKQTGRREACSFTPAVIPRRVRQKVVRSILSIPWKRGKRLSCSL